MGACRECRRLFYVRYFRTESSKSCGTTFYILFRISSLLTSEIEYFTAFDKVIVYYDNGQSDLSAVLNAVFSIWITNIEFRKAEPQKYRLLQGLSRKKSV